ncbi:hypothetical protein [Buttiauxella ferragutiae]|uniref:hypothetical protein n=1 Tax=Buttiauxella ferragutiae TaxID=82989 RepID=UPI0035241287
MSESIKEITRALEMTGCLQRGHASGEFLFTIKSKHYCIIASDQKIVSSVTRLDPGLTLGQRIRTRFARAFSVDNAARIKIVLCNRYKRIEEDGRLIPRDNVNNTGATAIKIHPYSCSNAQLSFQNNAAGLPGLQPHRLNNRIAPVNGRYRLRIVKDDGACLFRAYFALLTRDEVWLQHKTRKDIADVIVQNGEKNIIIQCIDNAITRCVEVGLFNEDSGGGVFRVALSLHSAPQAYRMATNIFNWCFVEQDFVLYSPVGLSDAIRSSTEAEIQHDNRNIDQQIEYAECIHQLDTEEFKDILRALCDIIFELIIKSLGIPTNPTPNFAPYLVLQGNHYNIMVPEGYFNAVV